jgi:type VI secretion system secreted protein Hcp
MPAFLKLGDIKGEASDNEHKDWIRMDSMHAPITRSIQSGATDQQRARGDTTLGDVVIIRPLDKSSPKLAEACASGKHFSDAEVHLCTTVKGKQEPYLRYLMKNVIISSYSFHGNGDGDPPPNEQITLSFTHVEWHYHIVDPATGDRKGTVPGKYAPATGKAG